METFQYRKSSIWEMKEDKYIKSLAKNQVCAIFHMQDIWKNVLPKFMKLCMETPCYVSLSEAQIWPPEEYCKPVHCRQEKRKRTWESLESD